MARPAAAPFIPPLLLDRFDHLVDSSRHYLDVLHPAYRAAGARQATMLSLPAFDRPSDDPHSDVRGIHRMTVLSACCIIAANRRGYLSRRPPGVPHAPEDRYGWEDLDSIVPEGQYYYYIDDLPPEEPYGIVPCFALWPFAADAIPAAWREAWEQRPSSDAPVASFTPSDMSKLVLVRDQVCIFSGYGDSTQNQHLIPRKERAWFWRNGMECYNLNQANTNPVTYVDDPRNGILVRSDLHTKMDQKFFTITCKYGTLVAHFLKKTVTIGKLLHNTEVRLNPQVALEFVWCRFAWTVLGFLEESQFTRRGSTMCVIDGNRAVRHDSDEFNDALRRTREQADQLQPQPSPRKRKANGPNDEDPPSSASGDDGATEPEECGGRFADSSYASNSDGADSDDEKRSPEVSLGPRPDRRAEGLVSVYPDLRDVGETEWSTKYSWQTAPWYPGIERAEALRVQWKQEHPNVRAPSAPPPSKKRRLDTP